MDNIYLLSLSVCHRYKKQYINPSPAMLQNIMQNIMRLSSYISNIMKKMTKE